jgi:molecular chaperone GrpE
MSGSNQSSEGKRPGEPGPETAPGSPAAPGPRVFGAAGPQVGASFGDDDITNGDDAGADEGEIVEGEIIDPLVAVTIERDEYLDALRRMQAEFDNYRKRVAKQQTEQAQRAAVSLVDNLLPVLDALELAATHSPDPDSADAKALAASASLLTNVLAKEGLERIDPVGQPFDPNDHEAVGHLPAEAAPVDANGDAGAEGDTSDGDGTPPVGPVVGQVMRPGYRWKGTVIRPAMVMVYG